VRLLRPLLLVFAVLVPAQSAFALPVARLRPNGHASAPAGAPSAVREVIAAGNRIVGKPYKWGGGHARIDDTGYDCSGTVSFTLIHAGLLSSPFDSRGFMRWDRPGPGRWITVYAANGHAYMEVAGLRLEAGGTGPQWGPPTGRRTHFAARHAPNL
jgi:hypothetical protein